jgi:hypothetical protein
MTPFAFLRTSTWRITLRLVLWGIVLILFYRSYGGAIVGWFQQPNPSRDLLVTHSEFRPDIPGDIKPTWIIGFKNQSRRYSYDRIELEATYRDAGGAVLQKDRLFVHHRLNPGEQTLIPSRDIRERPGATSGTLKVVGGEATK